MVPPADSRTSRLPSLAWESVVDDDPVPDEATLTTAPTPFGTVPADATVPLTGPTPIAEHTQPTTPPEPGPMPGGNAPIPPAPMADVAAPVELRAPAPSADLSESPMAGISFAPLTLDVEPVLFTPPPRVATVERRREPAPGPASQPAPQPERSGGLDDLTMSGVAAAPQPTVAPILTSTVGAVVEPAVVEPVVEPVVDIGVPSTALPTIVEATPVPDGGPFVDDAKTSGPRLPRTQPATPAPTSVPAHDVPASPTTAGPAQRHRKKTRRGFKLVLTLVVLGALVAAGVVFGRPYLFPGEWDADTQPFADAVEAASGFRFDEPFVLGTETADVFSTRMVGELVGDWTDDQATWRALGLLTGSATPLTVEGQLAAWQSALYSTEDGQVYRREGAADVETATAVSVALLDQLYRWSIAQPDRTLDDQALTLATVHRQAEAIAANSIYAAPVAPSAQAVVPFVPPLLGYQVLAPAVYAQFGVDDGARTLAGIGTAGPGPLRSEVPTAAPSPVMIGSDTLVVSPETRDRSFWFLVFAGLLDSSSAYRASEAIVESSLSVADRSGSTCVYATFAGGDVAQTATLRTALENWSATAPAAFGATFAVLAEGTFQLVSCDPGAGSEQPVRLGVAQELIAWRTAELATIEAVEAFGGGDAEIDAAWAAVEASTVGADLAALPSDTSPEATAVAAREAIVQLFSTVGG